MREASHRNLYAVANSCGMNGMGPDTVVNQKTLIIETVVMTLMILFIALFMASLAMFIINKIKFKKTDVYKEYQALRKKA